MVAERGGGGVPLCEYRSPALSCIPAERTSRHRPQPSPRPKASFKHQVKNKRKEKLFRARFQPFPCLVAFLVRDSGCGMVYVSSTSCVNLERKWFMSA